MTSRKIAIVVQARFASQRLPGKVLRPIRGKPMLGYLVDRLRRCREVDRIILATSARPTDDAVAAFAETAGIACHRGPEDDVLGRFVEVARRFALDAVVRVNGDSPLLDPAIVDAAVALFREGSWDLVTNVAVRSFPKGQSVEVIAAPALERAAATTEVPAHREHVTQYFYAQPEVFRIRNIAADEPHPDLQLSVDVEADFRRAEALIEAGGADAPLDRLIALVRGSTKRLRAGVIGLGVGEQHIHGYRLHPACDVVAVADIDPAKREMARQRYPELQVHASAEALLDSDLDVVSIASYDDDHFDQARRAIDAGKHLFVEKPLCWTEEQLAELVQGLRRQPGVRLSSNLILRLSPRFIDLRRRIAAGEFGQVFSVEADYNYGRLEKITTGWRARQERYSVMLGGGIHMVDLLRWLSGDAVVEVMAWGNAIASRGSAFRFNDLSLAMLRWDSGLVGKVSANFGCVHPHFHRLMVYGTAATFENRREHALLWRSRDPQQPPEQLQTAYPGIAKGALIPSFIDGILGLGTPIVDEAAVFDTMSVCLAIERSMREGRPVSIPRCQGEAA